MKKYLPLCLALSLLAAPAFANMGKDGDHRKMEEHMFQKMDANGDGNITKEEYDAFMQKKFDEADTNHDGMISKQEFMDFKAHERAEWKSHDGKKQMDKDMNNKGKANTNTNNQ